MMRSLPLCTVVVALAVAADGRGNSEACVELLLSAEEFAQGEPVLAGVRVGCSSSREGPCLLPELVVGHTVHLELISPRGESVGRGTWIPEDFTGMVRYEALAPGEGRVAWEMLNVACRIAEPGTYGIRASLRAREALLFSLPEGSTSKQPRWTGVARSAWRAFDVVPARGDALEAFDALVDAASGRLNLSKTEHPNRLDVVERWPATGIAEYLRLREAIQAPPPRRLRALERVLATNPKGVLLELAEGELIEYLLWSRDMKRLAVELSARGNGTPWTSDARVRARRAVHRHGQAGSDASAQPRAR